ncbi:unnamed protein product [Aphis gossypii]|uniref:Uncharacterized protein n=1 Tax=Aphis gossypii TaxID=80765 RepID=A0A9P0J7S1_APHGO|nr:unnamed protein product [Aphis gossypii]
MYIFISVFYFIFNDRLYTPVAATTMPATTTIRRQRFIVRFDSISVFLVSFFFIFLIILVVLVAAEVFLPIIFFVNWLGSHAARVSRRRRRNELADRLPPSSSLPFAISLLVALTVSHSFSQSLYLSFSLSLSLSRIRTLSDRRGLAVFNLYTYALVQAASICGGVIPPWSPSYTAAAAVD